MAENYKVLGQSAPIAEVPAVIYTVPASTEAVISSLSVCNRDFIGTWFRISVSPNGVATDDKHYIYYDLPIPGFETFIATVGITLDAADVVRVYAKIGSLSFSLFGTEITP
jgi:hypothetical protein